MPKLRALLVTNLGLVLLGLYQVVLRRDDFLFLAPAWLYQLALGILVLDAAVNISLIVATWFAFLSRIAGRFEAALPQFRRLGKMNWLFFLVCFGVYSYLVLSPLGIFLQDFVVRLYFFWLTAIGGGIFIMAANPSRTWTNSLVLSGLLGGIIYLIASYAPEISTYPFSLSWSEGSRYYYASLFFTQRYYGVEAFWPVQHPSRYLMQAVPFLIQGLPLWFHRFWQVALWLTFPALTVHLLLRRIRNISSIDGPTFQPIFYLFTWAWAYLFLFQGPVYYHLLVSVIIVILGYDRHNFWKTLAVVLLASAWAGISRLNWFPVPGLLAVVLYCLETPVNSYPRLLSYIFKPALWFILGTSAAFGAQVVYITLSGVEVGRFASSFTSDLLWYRLFPNQTFRLGILPTILIASIPALVIIVQCLRGAHPVRILGLSVSLLALFFGGMVVSVKIGGGSNLHNFDAFLVLLLVSGSYVLFGKVAGEGGHQIKSLPVSSVGDPKVFTFLLAPILFTINYGRPALQPAKEETIQALEALNAVVKEAASQGREVLFITQRHLLTFGLVESVPLVEEYENVFLMEMAMARDQSYLSEFRQDIKEQRFSVIITDLSKDLIKSRRYSFSEENNAWVRRVVRRLLDSYQTKIAYPDFGFQVLIPKP